MDFILVVFLFFTFLSLVGNSWVIFIIARRRRLRTTANWFILFLAAADLGVTCAFSPYMICEVILDTCKEGIGVIFTFSFVNVSAMGLIAMVAERYVAIVHSLKYVRVFTTTRRTFFIIGACWGFPFLFPVLQLAMYLAGGVRHSVLKFPLLGVIYIFPFSSVTNSTSLDSTFSYPINCSQTLSANESSHETSQIQHNCKLFKNKRNQKRGNKSIHSEVDYCTCCYFYRLLWNKFSHPDLPSSQNLSCVPTYTGDKQVASISQFYVESSCVRVPQRRYQERIKSFSLPQEALKNTSLPGSSRVTSQEKISIQQC